MFYISNNLWNEMFSGEIYISKGNKMWEGWYDILIVKMSLMYGLIENRCPIRCASVFNLLQCVVSVEIYVENLASHRY